MQRTQTTCDICNEEIQENQIELIAPDKFNPTHKKGRKTAEPERIQILFNLKRAMSNKVDICRYCLIEELQK